MSLIFVAGEMMQQLEDVCARHGLTHTQYNVLRILRGVHPEGHARCDIMERLIRRAPDVTRLIDRLEKQGWVERSWCAENRRLSIAKITREGLALLKKIDPEMRRVQEATVGSLSPAELKQFIGLCERIAAQQRRDA